MAQKMTDGQCRAFVPNGACTGRLFAVRADGRPDAAPNRLLPSGAESAFGTGKNAASGAILWAQPTESKSRAVYIRPA
jgi:hypothetical protein